MSVRSKLTVGAMALALFGACAVELHAGDKMMAPAGSMTKPAAMAMGSFRKAEAPVSGGFKIKKQGGKQVLVLSADFKTNDMAPDLKVAFSPSTTPLAMSKPPKYALKPGSYQVLAPLKSSSGAQSYVIPASINLQGPGIGADLVREVQRHHGLGSPQVRPSHTEAPGGGRPR